MKETLVSPVVLVHRPPAMDFIDEPLSHSFTVIYTHTSRDPLPDFLSSHAASVRAVVSVGRLPMTAEFLSNLPSLEPFGCIISYNTRNPKPDDVPYFYYPDILSLAAEKDVLILCCSLTYETRHIVNRDVMEMLGKNGIIINIGRGGLIDEREMVNCLVEGVIWGVGLDVFDNEPEVPEELFGLENVSCLHMLL